MNIHDPLPLLGGLSPSSFMKKHWQRKPLLVRGAIARFKPLVSRAQLFSFAGQDHVESRLIQRLDDGGWKVRQGPLDRRTLPPISRKQWTLLVQGMDMHSDAVHTLLNQFRFAPDARLDDLMISYATDGGGVGAHFDSYDVFLLQAHGQRRWRIGRTQDKRLVPDVPLKILSNFIPEEEMVLEPGDMLYLPPGWAHDGVAQGECMTYSVGFRAPDRDGFARDLLSRLSDEAVDESQEAIGTDVPSDARVLYRDLGQLASSSPAEIPAKLTHFARLALERALAKPLAVERALGEELTELKANVWFEAIDSPTTEDLLKGVRLDRRTRMLYDARHIFINGESYVAGGRDASLMQMLANEKVLLPQHLVKASEAAVELLQSWVEAGWVLCES